MEKESIPAMVAENDPQGRASEKGQSLVEFAISLVLLLIILSVIADASRALFTYLSMRDAAQEGALYASFDPENNSGIQARICGSSNYMESLCCPEGEEVVCVINDQSVVNIFPTPTVDSKLCMGKTGSVVHGITIRVVYSEFPLAMPFVGAFINRQTVPISVEITNAILRPVCE